MGESIAPEHLNDTYNLTLSKRLEALYNLMKRHAYEYVTIGPDTEVTGGVVPVLRTAGGYQMLPSTDVVGNGFELCFGSATRLGHERNFIPRVTGGGVDLRPDVSSARRQRRAHLVVERGAFDHAH